MKTSEKSTGRGLGKNIILLVVSLVLFLLLLEVAFRIFGPRGHEKKFYFNLLANIHEGDLARTGSGGGCFELDDLLFWKMRKNLVNCPWDPVCNEYISTNKYGLRGKDFPLTKAPNTCRIIALGDSVTYGLRVPPAENFSCLLEGTLNYDPAFSRKFEVINAGVPGYTSHQGLLYLKDRGLAFKPDLIIVSFGFNDYCLKQCSDRELGKVRRKFSSLQTLSSKILEFLRRKSAFVKSLNYYFYSKITKRACNYHRVPLDEYQENLQEMIDFARSNGIKIVFLAPPFRKEPDLSEYVDKMRYVAKKNGIPFVYHHLLTPAFAEENAVYFGDDVHPNANGHALLTELLYEVIKGERERLLPQS